MIPDDPVPSPCNATELDVMRARARLGVASWLDVRDESEFARGHLPGGGNVPLALWTERRHELPPREDTVVVIADDPAAASTAAGRLAALGYPHVEWLNGAWAQLGLEASREPAAPLWKPAAFLERVLPSIPLGRALDVACGAGREAVHMSLHGFEVEAWDRDAEALSRANALAARHGVCLRTVTTDLEQETAPVFGEAKYALVVCFRYLHRPLFPLLRDALAPGGHMVYETYREGQERYGRPRRPRFLLRPGELREAFAALELLEYEETSPEGGPVLARLHARKSGP